jgi:response regulator RpfG family c-di-GMP phosphodiesterase
MTHKRPYKEVATKRGAINEIKNCSGAQFDPNLVEAFMAFFDKLCKR